LIEQPGIVWHQRFPIAPGVDASRVNDIGWIAQTVGFPEDLTGKTVLDVGTTNGGAAFLAEARGAASVTATDIVPPSRFGFDQIAELLGSRVRFVESSVYELPEKLEDETFDLVIFWDVLYHLRDPLLGLDCVRRVAHGTTLIESAVCDQSLPQLAREPVVLCDAARPGSAMRRTGSCRTPMHCSGGSNVPDSKSSARTVGPNLPPVRTCGPELRRSYRAISGSETPSSDR
jgi:predicted nicotinamide N-methyase